jgi:predicted nucleic acid-binding protein
LKNIFLDSDVILDVLLKRPGFYLPAANLLAAARINNLQLFTSSVVFVNVNYFLEKFDRVNRVTLLKGLRSIISIVEVGGAVIDKALDSDLTDFEDAIQYYAALSAKADAIITRNIKDYKNTTIPVLTAEQFLNTL